MRISSILHPDDVVLDVGTGTKRDILARLVAPIAARRPGLDAGRLLDELERRENESSTAIADGIAIPHARTEDEPEADAAFGLSRAGVDFDSLDGQPTRFLLVLVTPASNPELHVTWLAHVARVLGDAPTRRRLLEAADAAEVLDILARRERDLEAAATSAEPRR